MKGKGIKFRDWEAVNAQFRNSAGAMKVKRQQEDRQSCRDFRKNWRDFADEAEDELSFLDQPVLSETEPEDEPSNS